MPLDRLDLMGLRNLADLSIHPSPAINLISGHNGAGKTSVLEGLYILGLARSFRTRQLKNAIHFEREKLVLFGQLAGDPPIPIGLARQREAEGPEIRLAGSSLSRLSELAHWLPMQLINADTFRLLEGPPKARREYLDWGVFHTQSAFMGCWQQVRTALKQRNALLRLRHDRIDPLMLHTWNHELAQAAERLDSMRQAYIELLVPLFESILSDLTTLPSLSLSYHRGWDRQRSLHEVLDEHLETDRQMGFTQVGPQRADLKLRIHRRAAQEVLSRGQQKMVVSALKLAQGRLLEQHTDRHCIYLIDDLAAELDLEHRQRFCAQLEAQQSQAFMTVIDESTLGYDWRSDTSVSHFQLKDGLLEK